MVLQVQVVMGVVVELSGDEGKSGESMSTYILIMAIVGMAAIGGWLIVKRRKGKM